MAHDERLAVGRRGDAIEVELARDRCRGSSHGQGGEGARVSSIKNGNEVQLRLSAVGKPGALPGNCHVVDDSARGSELVDGQRRARRGVVHVALTRESTGHK